MKLIDKIRATVKDIESRKQQVIKITGKCDRSKFSAEFVVRLNSGQTYSQWKIYDFAN